MWDRWTELSRRARWVQGPVFLLAGGVWDYYTLQLDRLVDNVLLAVYLFGFAAVTVLDFRIDLKLPVPRWAAERRRWVHLAGQFALGGLLSAYFVHYLRGAPVQRELLWLAILAGIALLNELADHTARLPWLRVPLLAFAGFNYLLAVLPFATGDFVGPVPPLLGASLLVVGTVWVAAWGAKVTEPVLQALVAGLCALGLQVVMVVGDWVPPLPLTLVSAEVTSAAEDDLYAMDSMAELLAPVGMLTPQLAWSPGEVVRLRTPVFLPKGMETTVVHRWARWSDGRWVTTDRIELDVRGGREEGFRTYSLKRKTQPGAWRVYVETLDGRELGRVTFDLVPAGADTGGYTPPPSPGGNDEPS